MQCKHPKRVFLIQRVDEMLKMNTYTFSKSIKLYKSRKLWNRSIENPNGAPGAAIPYCSTIEAERTWYCGPFDIIDTS